MLNLGEEPVSVFRQYMAEFALRQGHRLYAPDVLARSTAFAAHRGET
jgi:thioesterase DpgC